MSFIQDLARDAKLKRYGNSRPFLLNWRYSSYIKSCQETSKPTTDVAALASAQKVRDNGFVLIENAVSPDSAARMSDRITKLIESGSSSSARSKTAHLQYRVDRPLSVLGEEVLDLFRGPADPILQAYFGSWYRLFTAACYRSLPAENPIGAWLWHIDNNPPSVKKIMLYLTDCGPEQGVTSFISPTQTLQLREAGYRGILPPERTDDLTPFANKAGIQPTVHTPTVKAGSALFFDNNSLHRATIPTKGYRDVITFTVLPNPKPWDKALAEDGVEALNARSGDYPRNPSRN